ncbi:MAG: hypothetical protein IKP43_00635 [Bacteroidaceae bacterium]|jgi:hypothetical protein|nr:hypothetical protein [Bacteroidaceae bacterium]
MALFKTMKPRAYRHEYIYYNERKEKLKEIQDKAKRELGLLPPKEFSPEDIRGKFTMATKHVRRRKESGWHLSSGMLIFLIIALIILMRYLYTGNLLF